MLNEGHGLIWHIAISCRRTMESRRPDLPDAYGLLAPYLLGYESSISI